MAKSKRIARLFIDVHGNFSHFQKGLGKIEKELKKTSKKFTDAGKDLSKAITLPLLAFGGLALKVAEDFDQAMDKIAIGTGTTGDALKKLEGDFKNVFGDSVQGAADVAKAISDLNTGLGLSGQPLQDLSKDVLLFARLTEEDLGGVLSATTKAFNGWGVEVDEQKDKLKFLFNVVQSTGISFSELGPLLAKNQSTFRQLGFSFEESAAMLGQLSKAGVPAKAAITGLTQAIATMNKAGISDKAEFFNSAIDAIKNASNETDALAISFKLFGSTAGGQLAEAFRTGKIDADKLVDSINETGLSLQQTADNTDGVAEKLSLLKKAGQLAIEPFGNMVREDVLAGLDKMRELFGQLQEKLSKVSPETMRFVIEFAKFSAMIAGGLLAIGALTKGLSMVFGIMKVGVGAIAALFSPMGALLLLVGAVALAWYKWEDISNFVSGVFHDITDYANVFVEDIGIAFDGIGPLLSDAWNGALEITRTLLDSLLSVVGTNLDEVINLFTGLKDRIVAALAPVKTALVPIIAAIKKPFEGLSDTFGTPDIQKHFWGPKDSAEIQKTSNEISQSIAEVGKVGQEVSEKIQESSKGVIETEKEITKETALENQRRQMLMRNHLAILQALEDPNRKLGDIKKTNDKILNAEKDRIRETERLLQEESRRLQEIAQDRASIFQSFGQDLGDSLGSFFDSKGFAGGQGLGKLITTLVSGTKGGDSPLASLFSNLFGQEERTRNAQSLATIQALEKSGNAVVGSLDEIQNSNALVMEETNSGIDRSMGSIAEAVTKSKRDGLTVMMGELANSFSPFFQSLSNGTFGSSTEATAPIIGQTVGGLAGAGAGYLAGTAIGAAGSAVAGPLGAAIGQGIGSMLGGVIGGLFGNGPTNKETLARKDFEGWFEDKFEGRRSSFFDQEGGLKEFSNFFLGGDDRFRAPGEGQTDFRQQNIDRFGIESSGAFNAIGQGLREMLGLTEDVGGQIGELLMDNFSGNVDNLRFLMKDLSIDQNELIDALIVSGEKGNMTWAEVEGTLQNVGQAFGEGLVALGDFNGGFQQIIDSSGRGMRAIGGVQNAAFEAAEAGITSFDQWRQALLDVGNSVEIVDAFFSALQQRQLTSFDAIAGATNRTLGGVIADMQNFSPELFEQWSAASSGVTEYLTAISDIPAEVRTKLVVDIERNFGGEKIQQESRDFSPTPFALGGIVTKPTIGLIGEAGAEAVIPLKKLDALFSNMQMASNSNSVSYNIDARGAAPGVEKNIINALKMVEKRAIEGAINAVASRNSRGGSFQSSF